MKFSVFQMPTGQKIRNFFLIHKNWKYNPIKKRFAELATIGHTDFLKISIKKKLKNIRQMALETFVFDRNI